MDWTKAETHAFLTNFLPPGRQMETAAEKLKGKIDFAINHTAVDLRVDIERVLDEYAGSVRRARPGYVLTEEEAEQWDNRRRKPRRTRRQSSSSGPEQPQAARPETRSGRVSGSAGSAPLFFKSPR